MQYDALRTPEHMRISMDDWYQTVAHKLRIHVRFDILISHILYASHIITYNLPLLVPNADPFH